MNMRLPHLLLACCMLVAPLVAGDHSSRTEPVGADEAANGSVETSIYTFRKSIDEVQVTFSVLGANGQPVMALSPQELQVYDNSVRMRDVTAFASDNDAAVNLVVLLDCSESLQQAVPMVVGQVIPRLHEFLRTNSDHLALATFDSRLQMVAPIATPMAFDPVGLRRQFRNGPTAIFDAMMDITSRESWAARTDQTTRRALLLVSDGEDNLSYHTLAQVRTYFNSAQITVYTIHPAAHETAAGQSVLETLAEDTGGQYFLVANSGDVERAMAAITTDLRARYSLSYRRPPSESPSKYHEIRIVPSNRSWTVRARAGYFDPH